ncbi:MAG TPA: sulfite exporter TauE/SafE family protein [Allosphingosinicella sp.]|nr:sulfite exporter TauE/SafE family protein [Allosphingosinicella sp.]
MDPGTVVLIAACMAVVAALYSSVGHGGASAYLAIMALFAVAPETMRPTALTLNLVVAGIGAARYWLRGQTNFRLLFAFAVTAMPAAYLGGSIQLPPEYYRPLVGALLLATALRLFWQPKQLAYRPVAAPSLLVTLPVGAALGLLAGLTGTGGGIFLSPLIILFAWEQPRHTSGVAAGFIVLNSIAGLLGNLASVRALPPEMPWWMLGVALGAALGTWLGVEKLPRERLLQALGLVLTLAGFKLVLGG